jgi:hypothetical protein
VNEHLTPREISAWLAGDRAARQQLHIRVCGECRAAVERSAASLGDFRAGVREWTGREFSQARPFVLESRRRGVPMMRLAALAAMLAILAGVPLYLRDRAGRRAIERARQDAALLEQVQTELSRSVPEPMEPLTNLVSWKQQSLPQATGY